MKYRKLYERIVDNLVVDGLVREPLTSRPEYASGGVIAPVTGRPGGWEAVVAQLADARVVLNRVYALCYDDIALSIVSQVAREFGVKLDDTARTRPPAPSRNVAGLQRAADNARRDAGPVPEVDIWQCHGCTFRTADVEKMNGHRLATGHPNVNVSAPAAFAARMNPAPVPRTGVVYRCGNCTFKTGSPMLVGDHQGETGHLVMGPPSWSAARDDAQAVALRKVLDVLRGAALEQQAHNREDGKRLGPDHMVEVTVGRVRLVVSDAARELGVTL